MDKKTDDKMELHQIIYSLLAAQIEFGTYRFGDSLPRIEDASRWLSVSIETARAAYRRLKREGYITLTKKAGAVVAVQFQEPDFERHIQAFFGLRRSSVMDLCQSLGPLFSHAQWFALKNADADRLDEIERLRAQPEVLPPYTMVRHAELIYGALHNDLLLRLVWQAFLFYQAPFLSLPENLNVFDAGYDPLLDMLGLCRQGDWDRLWQTVASYQEQLTFAIEQFYETHVTAEPCGEPIAFRWNAYENTSQVCYSLAMELLIEIHQGLCKPGEYLPSPAKIAEKKQVSIITVRRTLALLNHLGATRSVNGVGTLVLDPEDSAKNCDFSQPAIQKRLLDFAQSLQILTLTCGSCVESAISAMDDPATLWWEQRLHSIKESQRHESVVFAFLELIPRFSPIRSVREIYSQLLQILIWGYPLRGLHGSREEINAFYLPYIDSLLECLRSRDITGLAKKLECLLLNELCFAKARLVELGIEGASDLVLPSA